MQLEKNVRGDLLIPRNILESAEISGKVQIILKAGELKIAPYYRTSLVKGLKGLGKSIQPAKSSVELVRELRAEWKIFG
jgi:hypothetical protein